MSDTIATSPLGEQVTKQGGMDQQVSEGMNIAVTKDIMQTGKGNMLTKSAFGEAKNAMDIGIGFGNHKPNHGLTSEPLKAAGKMIGLGN